MGIIRLVFYESAGIKISSDLVIGIDSPGRVMIKMEGLTFMDLPVVDPLRKLTGIHLTVSERIEKNADHFNSSWKKEKVISEISIDFPQGVYAGKSVTIKF